MVFDVYKAINGGKTVRQNNFIKHDLGIVICTMLVIIGISLVCSVEDTQAASSSPTISVSTPARIDLEIMPSSNGGNSNTVIGASNVVVKSTDSEGFRILLHSQSSSLSTVNGKNSIPSIVKNTAAKDIPTNSWGVYLGGSTPNQNSTFKPLSITPTEMVKNELEDASGTYKLALAAKADTNLPAGYYYNELIISVVANPKKVMSLADATYMQDVTPEVCESSKVWESVADEVQLIDARDGNKYWVAKLADERCWMVQNLALTFGDPTVSSSYVNKLTPADSDVSSEWSFTTPYPGTNYTMRNTEFSPGYFADPPHHDTKSWNLGKWVLATPLLTTSCGDTSSAATCVKIGLVNVADEAKFTPGYKATTTNWNGANATNNTLVAVNCTEWSGSGTSKVCIAGTYDEHYLIGNYYQFNAAAAGSDSATSNVYASDSICPKGWQLPTAGTQANSLNGSFYYMLSKYGLTSALSAGNYNIAAAPLYFVRSGAIDMVNSSGAFRLTGQEGRWWSSRVSSPSIYTYFLQLNADTVYTSSSASSTRGGVSVRCLNAI